MLLEIEHWRGFGVCHLVEPLMVKLPAESAESLISSVGHAVSVNAASATRQACGWHARGNGTDGFTGLLMALADSRA